MKLILFLGLVPLIAGAATFTANTCNYADVNGLINNTGGSQQHLAVDGDVINIPSGTCIWSTALSVSVGISIIGAGSSATTLTDQVTGSMFSVTIPSPTSSTFRLSGMTIGPGAKNSQAAVARITGICNTTTCAHIRIDNMTFPSWRDATDFSDQIIYVDNVFGVLDHNTVSYTNGGIFVTVNHSSYLTTGGSYGDNSWATPDSFGTDKELYIENNTFTTANTGGMAMSDSGSGGGARFVGRFNTLVNGSWQTHGTESTGRTRSVRHIEIYNNTLTMSTGSGFSAGGIGLRGGTALVFDNSYDNGGSSANGWMNVELSASNFRDNDQFPAFGACDGLGSYDQNDGVTYASGTVTATSTSPPPLAVTDSTQAWTTPFWVANPPYNVVNIDRMGSSSVPLTGQVSSGNATTVNSTFYAYWGTTYGQNTPWQVGDHYQILRASTCIDQVGHGGAGAVLLSGTTPTPTGWVNEPLDPAYEWGSTYNNGGNNRPNNAWVASNGTSRMANNKDYYQQISPFTGASGTGTGLLSARPTTCTAGPGGNTPGVAYWATDQGSWNQSGSGGQGQLYVCNPTNTWSLYYTPYTYPHPLDSGATVTPPVITTTSPLPGGTVGVAYSMQFAASGTAPITWSATGTPAGLTLSSTGLLSGTPTTEGGTSINVTASNSAGMAGPTAFAITISPGVPSATSYSGTLSGSFH